MEPLHLPATASTTSQPGSLLLYSIDDVPPWYLTILLGFQHFLTMFGAAIAIPFLLSPSLCIGPDDPARSYLISTLFFVSGIVTFLQTTCGIRLPILQGGTFTLLVPTFAILNLSQWECPKDMAECKATTTIALFKDIVNPLIECRCYISSNTTLYTQSERDIVWKSRICEIQGAIVVAGVFELLFGASGLIGLLLPFITPLVIAPVIALVGFGLVDSAANLMSGNWIIALVTAVLIGLFSVYLKNIKIPLPIYKSHTCRVLSVPFFKLFPVLLTLIIMWIVCFILTETDVLHPGNAARTDLNLKLLHSTPWFGLPYPFQWGFPTFSLSAGLGMLGGILASIVESVGDYYACAKLCGAPRPPDHAINRGILVEGAGTILAGLFGTGNGTTSYSENIGVIGIIKVGSRRVLQSASLILVFFGIMSKFGAFFVTIPAPLVGGIFLITFSMITATGLSQIQYINLNSSRNLFVLGVPLFCGLVIPKWLEKNKDAIKSGNVQVDNTLEVLLSTSVFVGGFLAIVLDNTVPGLKKERGLTKWEKPPIEDVSGVAVYPHDTYDCCFAMNLIIALSWTKYVPFCPTFKTGRSTRRETTSEKTEITPPQEN